MRSIAGWMWSQRMKITGVGLHSRMDSSKRDGQRDILKSTLPGCD